MREAFRRRQCLEHSCNLLGILIKARKRSELVSTRSSFSGENYEHKLIPISVLERIKRQFHSLSFNPRIHKIFIASFVWQDFRSPSRLAKGYHHNISRDVDSPAIQHAYFIDANGCRFRTRMHEELIKLICLVMHLRREVNRRNH